MKLLLDEYLDLRIQYYQLLTDELLKRHKATTALELIGSSIDAHKRYLYNCQVIIELCKIKSFMRNI